LKDDQSQQRSSKRDAGSTGLIATSLLVFACGVCYYLTFRHFPGSPTILAHGLLSWIPEPIISSLARITTEGNPSDWSSGTFPSFAHMLTLGLLSFGTLGYSNGARLTVVVLAMTIVAEFNLGVTDPHDLFAALLGTTVAVLLASRALATDAATDANPVTIASYKQSKPHRVYTALSSIGILLCSTYFITGTSCENNNCFNGTNARPVYMDYNTLRNSVAVEAPKEIGDVKRVYLYQQYIFLNRKNEGIHVIDNTDPSDPDNIRFIKIPGNTELAIRDNYLYADSYVDLVTLNLSNPQDIQEVARQIDVFPWDEKQNVPDNIYFDYFDIDKDRGVVVSYEIK